MKYIFQKVKSNPFCGMLFCCLVLTSSFSCTSKKDILYFQDSEAFRKTKVISQITTIQPNDILSVQVEALVQETALPYNKVTSGNGGMQNIEMLKLQGYLVDQQGEIKFPVLGSVSLGGLNVSEAESYLEIKLVEGNHLALPKVTIRILNSKVTVLGLVNRPGTYSFTEQYITLPQALGYAGDLTINAKRDDIVLIREENGVRTINKIDMTTASWLNDPSYAIRQNDIIVVNPNAVAVKSAGFVGNVGTVLTITSLLLSSVILLTR